MMRKISKIMSFTLALAVICAFISLPAAAIDSGDDMYDNDLDTPQPRIVTDDGYEDIMPLNEKVLVTNSDEESLKEKKDPNWTWIWIGVGAGAGTAILVAVLTAAKDKKK